MRCLRTRGEVGPAFEWQGQRDRDRALGVRLRGLGHERVHRPSRTCRAEARWTNNDDDRPLTTRGVAQASVLTAWSRTVGVDSIMSSPTRRCIATVEGIADALDLPVVAVADLGLGDPPRAIETGRRPAEWEGGRRCVHARRDPLADLAEPWAHVWCRRLPRRCERLGMERENAARASSRPHI